MVSASSGSYISSESALSDMFFFFFSSRRRHTRLQGDWSSDVCSSDLAARERVAVVEGAVALAGTLLRAGQVATLSRTGTRSEERRVGKECRSRWSPYH